MKRLRFGTPEEHVPSKYCDSFNYVETDIKFPTDKIEYRQTAAGSVIQFPLEDDCRIFGFGLQMLQFQHRGQRLRLAVNADPRTPTGDSHAPVPFFVTNKGWGMFFDTARYAEFYCGYQKANIEKVKLEYSDANTVEALYATRQVDTLTMDVKIPAAQGIDVYIIEGDTITDIVAQYNMLAGGGPANIPEWSLGLLYRCYGQWNSDKIIEVVDYFRDKNIPCDIIGLEPGWHEHAYPCTYTWRKSNYPDPDGFIDYVLSKGYHINLWEHSYTHPNAPFYNEIMPHCGEHKVFGGLVPDLATEEASNIFAEHHRKNIIAKGIDGFKLDECDSSDFTGGWCFPLTSRFPSGMDGEQYHSMHGVLYCKTLMKALDGKPTLSEIRSMGSLAAPYPFVLYGDLYDHRTFIRALVNSGFSGLLWSPEFREAGSKNECIRRIQTVVFSVQCLVNAWNYDGIPWIIHECEDEVRELIELRYKLIPMIKASLDKYHETGKAPVRALVSDFTDDENTYSIDDEYLFCDDLLVAPIFAGEGDERDVYLPVSAKWADFYTGEEINLPKDGCIHVCTENIPVYKRIG